MIFTAVKGNRLIFPVERYRVAIVVVFLNRINPKFIECRNYVIYRSGKSVLESEYQFIPIIRYNIPIESTCNGEAGGSCKFYLP